ncbi:family 78 glycoside hydrolase catalytic domain [Paenarthrobacter nicotinovorans]|uniref:alpha-L-rhamnosidase n=1 Tax=Paenarthrobacter nicotinovorans TaxID=29320 RepID=UPI00374A8A4A
MPQNATRPAERSRAAEDLPNHEPKISETLTPAEALEGAIWIAPTGNVPPAGERPGYEFRRFFDLVSLPDEAVLWATAHGVYEVFVNGVRAGDIELAPGATSYRRTLYVQHYDVKKLLCTGRNELRFVVTDGWYRGKCGPSRIPDNFGTQIGLIASLALRESTETVRIGTDRGWEVARGNIISADLMDGQHSDLRMIGHEIWESVDASTDPLTLDTQRLAYSPAPPVRAKEKYRPVSVRRLASGRQIVDFGQILNGRVRLSRLGASGTRTELTHGEALDPDGNLTLDNLAFYQGPDKPLIGVGQRDVVISRGIPGDIFEPRHTTHGFRYVAVDGLEENLGADDITAIQLRSDLAPIGEFKSSDESLNTLHSIALASWHANTCDLPTDCPQRERWGYTGDIQIFARSAAFLDDIEAFAKKWLRSLADDQFGSGLIPNVAPLCGIAMDPHMPISFDGAAGWGDAATIVPWELYRQYGDKEVLKEFFPMMARWVDFVATVAATGRHPSRVEMRPEAAPHEEYIWDTGWQWGEWLEPEVDFDYFADKGIIATAYFAHSARIVADAAGVLGRDVEAAKYRELSTRAIAAWQTEFVNADGSITSPTQANYTRGLAFGLFPEEHCPAAAAHLARLIRENGNRLSTGFLSTGLLLPALADNGYTDLAFTLLFQREEPSWMTMLDRGATTVWEAWNGVDADGASHESLNHYSKGAVIAFLHEYVAGIRPAAPGYAAVEICPHPHPSLTSASATLATRHGEIVCSWTTADDVFQLELSTPLGVSTTVRLPDGTHRVTQGGTHLFTASLVSPTYDGHTESSCGLPPGGVRWGEQ